MSPVATYEREDEEAYQKNERAFKDQAERLRNEHPNQYVAFVDGEFAGHHEDLNELARMVEENGSNRNKRFYAHTAIDYEQPTTLL